MKYWITDTMGSGENQNGKEYTIDNFSTLLDMLNEANEAHCDISLTHETEWCLSVFKSLKVVWENLDKEDVEPRYQEQVSVEDIARLWKSLSEGKLEIINNESWLNGYGN